MLAGDPNEPQKRDGGMSGIPISRAGLNQVPGSYTRAKLKAILKSLDLAPIPPEALKRLRLSVGDSMEAAAARVRKERQTWWRWELPLDDPRHYDMPEGLTELYLIKVEGKCRT